MRTKEKIRLQNYRGFYFIYLSIYLLLLLRFVGKGDMFLIHLLVSLTLCSGIIL